MKTFLRLIDVHSRGDGRAVDEIGKGWLLPYTCLRSVVLSKDLCA